MQKVKVTYVPRQIEYATNRKADRSGLSNIDDTSFEDILISRKIDELQRYFEDWWGVRYRFGGVTTKGVDCSGLVLRTYKELYDVELPRTVAQQAQAGTRINKNSLLPGDLIFFKTGRNSRHVGIYLGEDTFVHASRSKGVIRSSLNNVYWQAKYWLAKRVQPVKS